MTCPSATSSVPRLVPILATGILAAILACAADRGDDPDPTSAGGSQSTASDDDDDDDDDDEGDDGDGDDGAVDDAPADDGGSSWTTADDDDGGQDDGDDGGGDEADPFCLDPGEHCGADDDCCSGSCGLGICRFESCVYDNDSCFEMADCCGDRYCASWWDGACAPCKGAGGLCSRDEMCCSRSCSVFGECD